MPRQSYECSLNAKGYLFALNSTIGFACSSLIIIIILIFGPIYNHTYPDVTIYYIILFQTVLFVGSLTALIAIPVSNRPEALALCWKEKTKFDEKNYMGQRTILITIIILFAIGEAAALGGVIWRLVLYTRSLNLLETDPQRTGANGTTALVLSIFDVISLIPPIGIFISTPFAWKFLEALNDEAHSTKRRHKKDEADLPSEPEEEEEKEKHSGSENESGSESEHEHEHKKSRHSHANYSQNNYPFMYQNRLREAN